MQLSHQHADSPASSAPADPAEAGGSHPEAHVTLEEYLAELAEVLLSVHPQVTQIPMHARHVEASTFCAMQEDKRIELDGLLESISSSLACSTTPHDACSKEAGAALQHEGESGHAEAAAAAHARGSCSGAELGQSLVQVPITAEDAGKHAGLVSAMGAWRSSDRRRLYVAFPKPAASLADLLRFDSAALGPDDAVALLLYQACSLLVISKPAWRTRVIGNCNVCVQEHPTAKFPGSP